MKKAKGILVGLTLFATGCLALESAGVFNVREALLEWFSPSYKPSLASGKMSSPVFDELDIKRARIDVTLKPVAQHFIQITDMQFVPGQADLLVVLQKGGEAKWINLKTQKRGLLFRREVTVASEQGLLGLAFAPDFLATGRMYINETVAKDGKSITRVVALLADKPKDLEKTKVQIIKTIIEMEQPYANHNAGQLAFGPDGYLYIGTGDGGWADDPKNNGQKKSALLGKMLRVDVSNTDKKPYVIPADNPFVKDPDYAPEIWALGLRNPWRYSFDPSGRMVVADVGQNAFEEISILKSGDNAGWKVLEGAHCFEPKENCDKKGMVPPVYEYGRSDGGSITGGFVVTAKDAKQLAGKYVFGDFLSGRLWALELPQSISLVKEVFSLGRWPFLPSTFARDASGRVYVGAFRDGIVYRLDES